MKATRRNHKPEGKEIFLVAIALYHKSITITKGIDLEGLLMLQLNYGKGTTP